MTQAVTQSPALRRFALAKLFIDMVGTTGFEPATSSVSRKRSNQLSYAPEWNSRYPVRSGNREPSDGKPDPIGSLTGLRQPAKGILLPPAWGATAQIGLTLPRSILAVPRRGLHPYCTIIAKEARIFARVCPRDAVGQAGAASNNLNEMDRLEWMRSPSF